MIRRILKFNLIFVWLLLIPITVLLLVIARFTPFLQIQIICAVALTYFGLAVLHHYKDKTISLEVIIEYLLMIVLALVILLSIRF